jgi:GNAT superfamily N-acetyltransferase
MKKATILLIQTPVRSPAIPSLHSAMVAASLSGANLNCLQYDANLDFFLNYVLSKDRLPGYLEMIKKRMVSGVIPDTDSGLIEGACQRIAKATISIDLLRTNVFYEPEKLLAVKNHIDDLLLCFSIAFYPYKIGWGSFSFQTDLFDEDQSMNPFLLFCKEGLRKEITRINPEVVVLFISSSDQVMAGKTMAGFIKSNFPGMKVIVIKDPDIFVEENGFFDHSFSMDFLDPFFKLIHRLYNAKINFGNPTGPDFKSLPLKDYLSPIFSNSSMALFFEDYYAERSLNQGGNTWIDSDFKTYTNVARLPGDPFWKILEDPVYLWLYLNKYNKKVLSRMRADRKEVSVITLGSHIRFHFKKPDDLPSGFLDEICRMVEAGGSVDSKYVRYNLERAYLIGYAMENDIIIGNSSLKHPREEFIERINRISGLDFTRFLERGYTSVRPEYRALGVGVRLLEGLTARVGDHKIFSIISEDNKATQKIALRTNTRKIVTYYSEKVGKELGVWMPEQMIEENWNLTK